MLTTPGNNIGQYETYWKVSSVQLKHSPWSDQLGSAAITAPGLLLQWVWDCPRTGPWVAPPEPMTFLWDCGTSSTCQAIQGGGPSTNQGGRDDSSVSLNDLTRVADEEEGADRQDRAEAHGDLV